ncbi:MAG: hypothetical protein LBS19_16125 [Clostridiales bacterium]|jgi:hypothetical protein|nr:hypothetical protein [Clostridiales bacterium]
MKRLTCVLLTVISLCFLSGCITDVAPRSNFPLNEAAIIAALEETGLPGSILEEETHYGDLGNISYVIRNPEAAFPVTVYPESARTDLEDKLVIAAVNSAVFEGEQFLSVIYVRRNAPDTFAWEDWKQHIVFATLLNGGYEDEEDIYRAFLDKERPDDNSSFTVDAQLTGRYCVTNCNPPSDSHSIDTSMVVSIFESQEAYQNIQDRLQHE